MYIFALAINIYSNPMNMDHEAAIQRKCSYLLVFCKTTLFHRQVFHSKVDCLDITFKLKLK